MINPLSLFGGLQAKLIAVAVAAVIVFAGGAYAGYRWEHGEVLKLQLADAQAMLKATQDAKDKQHKIDLSGQAAGELQAYLRGKLDGTIINFKLEAPANVTITQDQEAAAADHTGCVTYGFYRMLYAGERGVTAASLTLPAGATVDACTAEPPSELAASLSADLGDGFSNGQQLNALIGEVTKQETIRNSPQ